MVVEVKRQICDGHHLKWLVAAGLAWLEHNKDKVNQLNVFPVPDGDTGTNMCLTMQKAYQAIKESSESHVGIVSETVARGALLGARGNSGVILSQILQGFAHALRGHEFFDAALFAHACTKAVDAAYRAVIDPVEGTILTVVKDTAKAAVDYVKAGNTELDTMLEVMLLAAKQSLERTPELLPVLKKAGVIDSGGQGFVTILEGMVRLLHDEPVFINDSLPTGTFTHGWEDALQPDDEEGYGYDVQFLIHGQNLDVAQIRADIDAMGWSTLVVGDEKMVKVHVHVHNPGEPISYAIQTLGAEIDDVVVENMQRQYENYVSERQEREQLAEEESLDLSYPAVITVVNGDGMSYLFRSDLGAKFVIAGGQTMNPSTEDFIEAINRLPHPQIILLPNNKNVLMAAKQAAELARDRAVRVVPSRTIPQGISAMIAYGNLRESQALDAIADGMTAALDQVRTAEITHATRAVELDGVRAGVGQLIGMLEGELVAVGDTPLEVVDQLLSKADASAFELITLYYGNSITAQEAEALAQTLTTHYPNQEVVLVYGGQPLYPYIISLE